MSNSYQHLPGGPNKSPIAPTGFSVVNCRVDAVEYRSRGIEKTSPLGQVAQFDILYARKSTRPSARARAGLPQDTSPVFATFNAFKGSEDDAYAVGIAISDAQLSQSVGAVGEVVTAYRGGNGSVISSCRLALPAGARVLWRIPRDGLTVGDRLGQGRMVGEMVEMKPTEVFGSESGLHAKISTVLHGLKLEAGSESEHQAAKKVIDQICIIMMVGEITRKAAYGETMTDADKKMIAVQYGVLPTKNSANKEAAAKFKKTLVDRLFLMQFKQSDRTSSRKSALGIYTLAKYGGQAENSDEQIIAYKQSGAVGALLDTISTQMDALNERVLGRTPSGGPPGALIDFFFGNK